MCETQHGTWNIILGIENSEEQLEEGSTVSVAFGFLHRRSPGSLLTIRTLQAKGVKI